MVARAWGAAAVAFWLIAGATAAAPPVPDANAAVDWDAFAARYEALGRVDLSAASFVVHGLELPADGAFALRMDWSTRMARAVPVQDVPLVPVGCVTPGPGAEEEPWAVPGTGTGPCPHPGFRYSGGLLETVMVCAGVGTFCFTDGANREFGFFVIACGSPQAATGTWPTGSVWSVPLGTQCGTFAGGLPPPAWDGWDSICAFAFGEAGLYACGHVRGP